MPCKRRASLGHANQGGRPASILAGAPAAGVHARPAPGQKCGAPPHECGGVSASPQRMTPRTPLSPPAIPTYDTSSNLGIDLDGRRVAIGGPSDERALVLRGPASQVAERVRFIFPHHASPSPPPPLLPTFPQGMYEFAADVGMIDQNGELPEVRMHGERKEVERPFFHIISAFPSF